MAISVQQLVQQACEQCSLTAPGKSVSGNISAMALKLLNNLLSELNNQDYITSSIETYDVAGADKIRFKSEGNIGAGDVSVSIVPNKVIGVSRKLGDRWVPLYSCNRQQIDQRTKRSLPTSWCYEIEPFEYAEGSFTNIGVLTIDSNRGNLLKVYVPKQIVADSLNSMLYISDIYYDLLLQGMCVKLCDWAKTYEYKAEFNKNFKAAKGLIKRTNQTQRMLQNGDLQGGYDDNYYNAMAGVGW